MSEFWTKVVDIMHDAIRQGERHVVHSFYNMKRKMFRFATELVVFSIAIVLVLVGGVMLLSRYFPLDWIMLIVGLLIINFVLITAKFK